MGVIRGLIPVLGLAVAGLAAAAGASQAQVTGADVGVNPTNEQTGPTTVTPTGGFFSARAFVNSAGDFTGGTLTYGGAGSPQTLGFVPSDVAWEFGAGDASFSNLQTQFPTGDYTFGLTGGGQGPESVTVNYAGDAYSNTPELTAASYTGLQGLNAADPYSVDFNSMVVSPNSNLDFVFFSIVNSSNVTVFSDGFLPSSTTSVNIPGGTLLPGQTYSFDLNFDGRITGNDPNGVPTTQFYDTHTAGAFFTEAGAVPEPSTWAMLVVGFGGLGFMIRRRAVIEAKAA